uniref:Uncharacterized protein n=1 Tax=Arundo donax TaxID=35708 RepID=A0A0A9FD15_ARUDO
MSSIRHHDVMKSDDGSKHFKCYICSQCVPMHFQNVSGSVSSN